MDADVVLVRVVRCRLVACRIYRRYLVLDVIVVVALSEGFVLFPLLVRVVDI